MSGLCATCGEKSRLLRLQMHLSPRRYETEEHRETKRFLTKRFKGCELFLPFSFNIHQTYTQHYILYTHSVRQRWKTLRYPFVLVVLWGLSSWPSLTVWASVKLNPNLTWTINTDLWRCQVQPKCPRLSKVSSLCRLNAYPGPHYISFTRTVFCFLWYLEFMIHRWTLMQW